MVRTRRQMTIVQYIQSIITETAQKVKDYWLYFYLPPDGRVPCPAW